MLLCSEKKTFNKYSSIQWVVFIDYIILGVIFTWLLAIWSCLLMHFSIICAFPSWRTMEAPLRHIHSRICPLDWLMKWLRNWLSHLHSYKYLCIQEASRKDYVKTIIVWYDVYIYIDRYIYFVFFPCTNTEINFAFLSNY